MRRCGTESRPRVTDIVAAAGLSNEAFYRHFALQGRAGRRHPRGRHRAAGSYVAHQMERRGHRRGQGPPLGRGRALPGGRRRHRLDHPRRALERGQPAAATSPPDRRSPPGRWPRCCASRSPSSAAPIPISTRRWPPTRRSASWPTGCGSGPAPPRPTSTASSRFCLAGRAVGLLRLRPPEPEQQRRRAAAAGDERDQEPGHPEQVVPDVEGLVERPLAGSHHREDEPAEGERHHVLPSLARAGR